MSGPIAAVQQTAEVLRLYLWNTEGWHNDLEQGSPESVRCLDDSPEKLRRLLRAVEASESQVKGALLLGNYGLVDRELRLAEVAAHSGQRLFRRAFECTQLVLFDQWSPPDEPDFGSTVRSDLKPKWRSAQR